MEETHQERLKQLAQQLKDICNKDGKETDLAKSAHIFHQLGLEHRKLSPDKFALIKSVGLLNAAIARNPDNVSQIENDLSQVCQHVLQKASAQEQTADLIKLAKSAQSLIFMMRSDANQALTKIKHQQRKEESSSFAKRMLEKISPNFVRKRKTLHFESTRIKALQSIQLHITKQYKSIMRNLSQCCEKIMGEPPCKFAVAGMGSIARTEITPYSDFEHIILLEDQKDYEKNLQYFRWFSVIFHVVVLNLQETIVPSLNVEHLNNETSKFGDWFFDAITKNGVSFDGMMAYACKFPLGRQQHTREKQWKTELIQPVTKMLQYLTSQENIKNGYHLGDILTATCYIYGDQAVYHQFESGSQAYQTNKTYVERTADITEQVKSDLDKFSTRFSLASLNSNKKVNIKQLFYRSSTLFISAMGKIFNLKSSSCFDIVCSLANQNKISQNTKHKLLYAVAIACEIRLSMYMENKSQYDYVHPQDEAILDKFSKMVGHRSIIHYFQITYCLQCEIVKLLNLKKYYLYSKPKFMNITICYALRLDFLLHSLLSQSSRDISELTDHSKVFNFDHCFDLLEGQISNQSKFRERPDTEQFLENVMEIAVNLHKNSHYDEALEFYKRLLEALRRMYPDALKPIKPINAGAASYPEETEGEQNVLDEALVCDDISDVLDEPILDTMEPLAHISLTHLLIADCLIEMAQPDKALVYTNRLDEILETNSGLFSSFLNELDVWEFYNALGNTLLKLKQYDRSLKYLQLFLKFHQPNLLTRIDQHMSYRLINTCGGIGTCLMELGEHKQSLDMLKNAIKLFKDQNTVTNDFLFKPAMTATRIYLNLGKCLVNLRQYDDALEHLYEGLQLIPATSLHQRNNMDAARILHEIGVCHFHLNYLEDSLSYFEWSIEIRANLAHDEDKDQGITAALNEVTACLRPHSVQESQ